MSSRRLERVAKLIKYQVSTIIQKDLADPRMGFTTVAAVDISPDLRKAVVYVSILGSQADVSKTLAALKQAEGFIRGKLAPMLKTKYLPQIVFSLSEQFQRVARLNRIFGELAVDRTDSEGALPEGATPEEETSAEGVSEKGELEKLKPTTGNDHD